MRRKCHQLIISMRQELFNRAERSRIKHQGFATLAAQRRRLRRKNTTNRHAAAQKCNSFGTISPIIPTNPLLFLSLFHDSQSIPQPPPRPSSCNLPPRLPHQLPPPPLTHQHPIPTISNLRPPLPHLRACSGELQQCFIGCNITHIEAGGKVATNSRPNNTRASETRNTTQIT